MSAEKQKRLYYPALDGLRFFAFLLVFINHAPYIAPGAVFRVLHEYGWMGVDLFLCLSAFLITKLLVEENKNTGNIDVHFFYLRRISKIWPLYFLFIGFVVIFQLTNHGWNSTTQLRLAGMALFADNILAAAFGYNHLFSSVHLWTISYEEQFYLIIPWLLKKLVAIGDKAKLILMTLALIVLSLIRIFFIYKNIAHPAIWVLPITHFESVLGGMALGLGVLDGILKKLDVKYLLLIGATAIGMVINLPNTDVTGWGLILTYPLIGIGMTLIVYAVLHEGSTKIGWIFRNRVTSFLGKISYGLYVYHILCLTIANFLLHQLGVTSQNIGTYPVSMFFTGITLVMLLAYISYYLYERPFLILKDKFTYIKSRPI
jgi:peptidoglycan/LPS O-acetylase OafA/YrhL